MRFAGRTPAISKDAGCGAITFYRALLVYQRNPFGEDLFLHRHRSGERYRTDLLAIDRRLRLVFGNTQGALDAAGLGARHVTGDAVDIRIIVRVDDDFVVGSDEFEDRI